MPDGDILNRLLILPNSGMEAYFIGILSFQFCEHKKDAGIFWSGRSSLEAFRFEA